MEAGSPPGTKSWARSVSVPIALLRSSSRRSGSILIAFEVTTFGYRGGKTSRERAISLMSRLTPVYTIYGLLSATSGLGVHHTGRPNGQTVGSTACFQHRMSVWVELRYHAQMRVVARSTQVCIYWLWKHRLLLSTYLRKRTAIYTLDLPRCLRPPRSAGVCPAELSATSV
jgi:hypothetical protein